MFNKPRIKWSILILMIINISTYCQRDMSEAEKRQELELANQYIRKTIYLYPAIVYKTNNYKLPLLEPGLLKLYKGLITSFKRVFVDELPAECLANIRSINLMPDKEIMDVADKIFDQNSLSLIKRDIIEKANERAKYLLNEGQINSFISSKTKSSAVTIAEENILLNEIYVAFPVFALNNTYYMLHNWIPYTPIAGIPTDYGKVLYRENIKGGKEYGFYSDVFIGLDIYKLKIRDNLKGQYALVAQIRVEPRAIEILDDDKIDFDCCNQFWGGYTNREMNYVRYKLKKEMLENPLIGLIFQVIGGNGNVIQTTIPSKEIEDLKVNDFYDIYEIEERDSKIINRKTGTGYILKIGERTDSVYGIYEGQHPVQIKMLAGNADVGRGLLERNYDDWSEGIRAGYGFGGINLKSIKTKEGIIERFKVDNIHNLSLTTKLMSKSNLSYLSRFGARAIALKFATLFLIVNGNT